MNKFQFAPADLGEISSLAASISNNVCIRSHNKRMKFCILSGKIRKSSSTILDFPLAVGNTTRNVFIPAARCFVFPQAYFPDAHITLPDDQQGVHFLQTHRYFHRKSFYVILNFDFQIYNLLKKNDIT